MARTAGALNKDHPIARDELARRAAQALLTLGGRAPSLRALADAAEVDPGTLRHYFGDREGVVRAAFESLLVHGEEQSQRALRLGERPAREALRTLATSVVQAWSGLLGGMHATGLVEGMAHAPLGQVYVQTILEPTLATVERLLSTFSERGELTVPDVRVAALGFMAPVMVACLHQHQLSGAACRPLELDAFVLAHVEGFLRGYARHPAPSGDPS